MKERVQFYDILRFLSILAVIIIHVVSNTVDTFKLSGIPASVYICIKHLMYFAVPMFIMISGALFLNVDKKIDIKTLYKKYILRIVIALFLFGMFYSMLEIYFNTRVINIYIVTESLKNILTGNLWDHMWYLYLIIGLYIITPLLKKYIENCTLNEYRYLLLILFIFTILFVDINNILKINIAFNILIISPYIFFYILGDYLSRFEISKKIKVLNYTVSLLSVILICTDCFIDIFNQEFLSYTCVMTTSIIISLFLLVKNSNINLSDKIKQILISISNCGFGIYLIHQFIINIIYKLLKVKFILNYPYIGLVIYVIFVFGLSYLITYLLRKIKLIRKYVL